MKRILALVLTGAMLCAMPVMAASSPSAAVVSTSAEEAKAATVEAQAAEKGMSVQEYQNNTATDAPGIAEATPVGQGGHVIINGAPSNVTFQLAKGTLAQVKAAKEQATALSGKVMNVVTTSSNVVGKFGTATVNFYMPGVKAGQLIEVYQLVKGEWVKLTVAEIRADHVVVNLTQHGTLAFIEVPAPAAN
ncbi:MAG: hypothetical protein IJ029_04840 [Lachnospiraceae bacterium]|nr:hypothetical protein [Lachnospiraceae bacterium]